MDLFELTEDNDDIFTTVIKENLNQRRIILNDSISDDVIENIIMMIIKWNLDDKDLPVKKRKKIIIFINSDGGEVLSGSQILSSIITSKTPIVTIGLSKCASMASYILAAGHTRYCYDNTVVLYHDGQTGYVSSSNKGKDIQKFYDKLEERMTKFMIKHTNMSAEFLEEIKDREYYMFADEVKERGIVDGIIGVDIELEDIL